MKKLLLLLLLLGMVIPTLAQDSEETVNIKKSELTPEQKKKLESEKAFSVGPIAGIGHEIGVAVNESLSAVTNQASAFSRTGVGEVTIALVVWKVIGKDLMGYIVAFLMFLVAIPLWVWSYSRFIPKKFLKKEVVTPETGKVSSREYGYGYDSRDLDSGMERDEAFAWLAGHWGFAILLIIVGCLMMFGCPGGPS